MLRVGLTGGIGSGKSMVTGIFGVLGVPVSSADESARSIMNEDEDLKRQIIAQFGPDAYSGGLLNRSWMAGQVFSDKGKLQLLNSLVHPATIRAGNKWMEEQRSGGAPYAIREAALIFESRSARMLDYVIGVHAPAALRIQRTMDRDHVSREAVMKRMNSQISEDIKMKLCDFVIANDGQEAVLPQVLQMHQQLLLLAGAAR
jgi:dephospho-CoA kinase